MHLLYCTRNDLLEMLPRQGAAAEIGVAMGDFSRIILQRAQPKQLHLVDPWEFQDRSDYLADRNNVPQDVADKRFNDVRAKFSGEIERGQVVLHRAYSHDAAAKVADDSLDWVYIDAMHTKDAVLEDLRDWSAKVKAEGFILGHDYANHSRAMRAGFGVIEAVQEFCQSSGFTLAFITCEAFPTYLIVKNMQSDAWSRLMYMTLKHLPCMVELTDPFAYKFKQREYDLGDGNLRVVPSFSPPTHLESGSFADVAARLCRPGSWIQAGTEVALHQPGRLVLLADAIDRYELSDLTFLQLDDPARAAEILGGADATIARCAPVILIANPPQLDIHPAGYRCVCLSEGRLVDYDPAIAADALILVKNDDLWALQRLAELAASLYANSHAGIAVRA